MFLGGLGFVYIWFEGVVLFIYFVFIRSSLVVLVGLGSYGRISFFFSFCSSFFSFLG